MILPQAFPEKIKVGFVIPRNLSPEETELLKKMISALKLDPEKVAYAFDFQGTEDWKVGVAFVPKPLGFSPSGFWIETYGPQVLLKSPEFKSKAWSDLQQILPHL